jgi:uncharacterized circularly permuted ATP-grasp superfamily protein
VHPVRGVVMIANRVLQRRILPEFFTRYRVRRVEHYPSLLRQALRHLSPHACYLDGEVESRHIDLRPYVIYGEDTDVMPGGLTRAALTKGSLVVNSSQGGGSKDTWVLAE